MFTLQEHTDKGEKMNSEELKQAYLKSYKNIVLKYMPEAGTTIEKIAKNHDLTISSENAGYQIPGRRAFISKITTMLSSFIGPVETSRLEKELSEVKH